MKVTLSKTNNVNGIIAIELEKPDYQENVDKSLNQFRRKATIPGFRQGKAPKGLIQKMYGKSVLVEEINKLLGNELYKYIKDNNLSVLGEPLPNENEQKNIDFNKDENFEFKFDVALTPEFELPLNKKNTLICYNVKLEDDLLEKQYDAYKQHYGTYKKIESESIDTDLIKGKITELENGAPKEYGMVIESGVIMPLYIEDEENKKKFIGVKVGDSVVFNPKTAYNSNVAEIASLLQTTKEHAADVDSDFSFELQEITRYEEAEMNQELFDKVLGEGAVSSEEEFKTKIAETLNNRFKPAADGLFMKSARELILDKLKNIELPDAFLKRWLLVANEKDTKESIENEYPKFSEDLKYRLSIEKIVKEQDIKIEGTDLEAFATEMSKIQFAQYGMSNASAEVIENYAKRMLSNEHTANNIYERVLENKVMDWLKQIIKVNEKEISSKDFEKLLTPEESKNEN